MQCRLATGRGTETAQVAPARDEDAMTLLLSRLLLVTACFTATLPRWCHSSNACLAVFVLLRVQCIRLNRVHVSVII